MGMFGETHLSALLPRLGSDRIYLGAKSDHFGIWPPAPITRKEAWYPPRHLKYVKQESMLDRDPGSKLRTAIAQGSLDTVKRLVHAYPESVASADPLTRLTPVAMAAKVGQFEIFEFLLSNRAEENTISKVKCVKSPSRRRSSTRLGLGQ